MSLFQEENVFMREIELWGMCVTILLFFYYPAHVASGMKLYYPSVLFASGFLIPVNFLYIWLYHLHPKTCPLLIFRTVVELFFASCLSGSPPCHWTMWSSDDKQHSDSPTYSTDPNPLLDLLRIPVKVTHHYKTMYAGEKQKRMWSLHGSSVGWCCVYLAWKI